MSPRVSHVTRTKGLGMIRILLLALVGASLLSCGTDVRDGGDPTPQEVADEVVAVGRDVLPALSSALGVEAPNVPMAFTERSGLGLYDYDGTGRFQGVAGTGAELQTLLERAVVEGGMELGEATSLEDVRATRGNVMVRLSVRPDRADPASTSIEINIGSVKPISADASDVPTEPTGLTDLIGQ